MPVSSEMMLFFLLRFPIDSTRITHCICVTGLHAFEHEGIQNITSLKDQLIAAQHDQSPAILKRHGHVIARWQKLLADSDARKQRLLRMQDQFRQIEELYLTFAKKASAFNSWFENAEEDLTDPVRCNSIEEIRALRDAHAQFQVLLSVLKLLNCILSLTYLYLVINFNNFVN